MMAGKSLNFFQEIQLFKTKGLLGAFGDFSYVKAIVRYIGFDCGCFHPPFKQLSESDYRELAGELEQFNDLFVLSS